MQRVYLIQNEDGDICEAFDTRGKASAWIMKQVRDITDEPRGSLAWKLVSECYTILEIPVH